MDWLATLKRFTSLRLICQTGDFSAETLYLLNPHETKEAREREPST